MAKLTLFILVAVLAFAVHAFKSYDGYVLIEAIPRNQQDRQTVDYLQEIDVELDFWHESPTSYEIFVPPEKQEFVTDFLTRNGLSVRIIKQFSQSDIDKEMTRLRLRRSATFDYNDFNTFYDIEKEIGSLAARCPIGVTCTVESIAKTYEGRDLWLLKLSKPGENRKGVWIDATIHSREWLATATLLKITQHLVDDYSTDAEVKSLVDKYDFYLLIVANPDGYEYSWTNQRYWRKNRTPNSGSTCIGTDLNRNFDSKWRNAGTSSNACSDSYGGPSPASEIETQALQNAAKQYGPTLATSIHIHSYSQLWLIPWGSFAEDGISCNMPDDYEEMMVVANKVADAIQSAYGTFWKRGSVCTTIYPATGGAVDYFKESGGVKYTATPELRGTDFVVNKNQIEPSFREIWDGLIALFAALPDN